MAISRLLLVFDFDQTIIESNVDIWIRKLLPRGKVPKEIKDRFKEHNSWTEYMGDTFSHMHKLGVQKSEMLEILKGVPLTPGMMELLKYQKTAPSVDTIIASDANSLFISHILAGLGLEGGTGYKEIFSNLAEFDASGCLGIKHHHQHGCTSCPANLCKGTVLKEYLQKKSETEGLIYDRVAFVGDGSNDFCPCLGLGENDIIFPRKGYELLKMIEQYAGAELSGEAEGNRLKAAVIPWDNAHEILEYVQRLVEP